VIVGSPAVELSPSWIADGVMPSNDGRAMCSGGFQSHDARCVTRIFSGLKDPLMHRHCTGTGAPDGWALPELGRPKSSDPERSCLKKPCFKQNAWTAAVKRWTTKLKGLPRGCRICPEAAFKLYDTYGLSQST